MKSEFIEIGKLIKAARMGRQLSQLELAKRMKLSPASINQFEKGVSKPQLVDAFRLEMILEIKDERISQLVIGADYRNATGEDLRPFNDLSLKHRSGTEKVATSSVQSVEIEGEINGKVIRVPVKLPKDVYLKLEFQ